MVANPLGGYTILLLKLLGATACFGIPVRVHLPAGNFRRFAIPVNGDLSLRVIDRRPKARAMRAKRKSPREEPAGTETLIRNATSEARV